MLYTVAVGGGGGSGGKNQLRGTSRQKMEDTLQIIWWYDRLNM